MITQCPNCLCFTETLTVDGKCGKCGVSKGGFEYEEYFKIRFTYLDIPKKYWKGLIDDISGVIEDTYDKGYHIGFNTRQKEIESINEKLNQLFSLVLSFKQIRLNG